MADNSEKKCVVIHMGSHRTVAGFNSVELPTCVIPSCYLKKRTSTDNDEDYIFDTCDMLEIASPNNKANNNEYDVFTLMDSNGNPYNWGAIERQWRFIYDEKLRCSSEDYPLVITIPIISKLDQLKLIMEKYMELAFDKFNVPILQFILEPLAVSFSMGKKTALVIDIGMNGSRVTPIYDGIVIKKGVTKSKFGGAFLDFVINNKVMEKQRENSDEQDEDVLMNGTSEEKRSIDMWWEANSWIQDFKYSMLQVCDKNLKELERYYKEQEEMYKRQQEQMRQYNTNNNMHVNPNVSTLAINNPLTQVKNYLYKPKGTTIAFTQKDCLAITENLFNPKLYSESFSTDDGLGEIIGKSIKKTAASISSSGNSSNQFATVGPSLTLPNLVKNSNDGNTRPNNNNSSGGTFSNDGNTLSGNGSGSSGASTSTTPEQVYTSLLTNVIISGSTSLIDGMEQRIIKELSIRFPQYKLVTFANQIMMDRQLQTWLGASSMSNLPSWDLGKWYSKHDYDVERGSDTKGESEVNSRRDNEIENADEEKMDVDMIAGDGTGGITSGAIRVADN